LRGDIIRWLFAIGLLVLCSVQGAAAATLDRVRGEKLLHCGSTIRPGLAFPAADGTWHGLNVDLCRAIAVAVIGPDARIEFHPYILPASYDAVRTGVDAVSFLTASEIIAARLTEIALPGPPVFYETHGILVPEVAEAERLEQLTETSICAEPGTGAERSLVAYFTAQKLPLRFFPFQESDELLDAYYAGRCGAVANELTSLAALRLQAGLSGHASRLLAQPLSAFPVMASTGTGDARWAAVIDWTVQVLLRSNTRGTAGPGGGSEALPVTAPAIGLDPGWQDRVRQAVGSYADIFERNLGTNSPLDLPRGLNADWTEGGLLCPPYSE